MYAGEEDGGWGEELAGGGINEGAGIGDVEGGVIRENPYEMK